MPLGMVLCLGPGDFVLDGDPAPPHPNFRPVFCVKTAGWIKMVIGVEVGLSPEDFVFDVDPVPLPKKGRNPQFLAHVYCGQTAGWIKTPLGTEIDLGPGHFVLDGFPAIGEIQIQFKVVQQPPLFGPCLLWPRSPISATAEHLSPI